jgi:hypothetical protein
MGEAALPLSRLRSILAPVGGSRPGSMRFAPVLIAVWACCVAPGAALAQSGYQTQSPPSSGKFKPSASVRAAQRAAAGATRRGAGTSRRGSVAPARRSYTPLTTPSIAKATAGAKTKKKKKGSHKHKRKRHKPAASTYSPPRTTTDVQDRPTFVTKVLREVPTGVWIGLLALAALATALLAGYIVSAVRARRMTRQREVLRADVGLLQSALLPAVPARIAGVTVSAAYRPAGGPAAGGDFYDLFPLTR